MCMRVKSSSLTAQGSPGGRRAPQSAVTLHHLFLEPRLLPGWRPMNSAPSPGAPDRRNSHMGVRDEALRLALRLAARRRVPRLMCFGCADAPTLAGRPAGHGACRNKLQYKAKGMLCKEYRISFAGHEIFPLAARGERQSKPAHRDPAGSERSEDRVRHGDIRQPTAARTQACQDPAIYGDSVVRLPHAG